jgi:beta-xylosidase
MSTAHLRSGRAALVTLALALLLAGVGSAAAAPQRPDPVGSDPFRAGQPYRGDFPDPTVWRVGDRFFAASTTVAALSLPVTTSRDLRTWTAAPASDPAHAAPYDAMPTPARWASTRTTKAGRVWTATWAPSVGAVVNRRTHRTTWVAAYSVPNAAGRRCVSLARSASPLGPFVDASTEPLLCGPQGTIDPQLFVDRGRYFWLLYKVEGAPDRIWVRRLDGSASGFAPGSRAWPLLAPKLAWEGDVVENPAMIRFRKRIYLFYSGNHFGSTRYATGYARCKKVTGPCRRVSRLLTTGPYLAGPGGATPFVDRAGHLRLAYHAWRTGNVGYPASDACLTSSTGCAQRRMYVATLIRHKKGRLGVYRYW